MRPLDPIREQELLKLAERKKRQYEIQKYLQPTFENIARQHTPTKRAPKPYNAWGSSERSVAWKLKGIRNCLECKGNGFVWLDFGGDAFGWVRCDSCRLKLVSAKETQ